MLEHFFGMLLYVSFVVISFSQIYLITNYEMVIGLFDRKLFLKRLLHIENAVKRMKKYTLVLLIYMLNF